MNIHSILHEKLIELYCIYSQIKDFKEEISILRESISDFEEEIDNLEKIIIHELKSRDLNVYSYKDMIVKIIVKPAKQSFSSDEKKKKIIELVEDNNLDIEEKINNIFAIMKPQDTGINIEKLSIKLNKKNIKTGTVSRNKNN